MSNKSRAPRPSRIASGRNLSGGAPTRHIMQRLAAHPLTLHTSRQGTSDRHAVCAVKSCLTLTYSSFSVPAAAGAWLPLHPQPPFSTACFIHMMGLLAWLGRTIPCSPWASTHYHIVVCCSYVRGESRLSQNVGCLGGKMLGSESVTVVHESHVLLVKRRSFY